MKGEVIDVKQIDAKWSSNSSVNQISNMTLNIVSGKLYAVVGPVGSGKVKVHLFMRLKKWIQSREKKNFL